MRTYEENGKVYTMNDNGIVVEASEKVVETETPVEPLKIGGRVEAEGKRGTVRARTSSVYGDAFAVQFDDGSFEEYTAGDLSTGDASEDDTVFASTFDEAKARLEAYESLPVYTVEEIKEKLAAAEKLHFVAESAIRGHEVSLQDRIALDNILLITSNDKRELIQMQHEASLEQDDRYKRVAGNRYSLSENVENYGGPLMGSAGNEDASWLEDAFDGMTVTEVTDEDLAVTAQQMVDRLEHAHLANDDVVRDAILFQEDYLGLKGDVENSAKFAGYVDAARKVKLDKSAQTKEASVDNLDDFDASSLFL